MAGPKKPTDDIVRTVFGEEGAKLAERMAARARQAANPEDEDARRERLKEEIKKILSEAMPETPQPSDAYPLADDIGNTFMELSRLRAVAWAGGQVAQQCADATIDTDEKLNRSWLLFEVLEQRLSQLTWFVDEHKEGGAK